MGIQKLNRATEMATGTAQMANAEVKVAKLTQAVLGKVFNPAI